MARCSAVPELQHTNDVLVSFPADQGQFRTQHPRADSSVRDCLGHVLLVRLQGRGRQTNLSDGTTGVPSVADTLDFLDEVWAVDLERSRPLCPARVVIIGYVEWVSQQADVCSLQRMECLKYD